MVRKNCDGCGKDMSGTDFEGQAGGLPEGLKQVCEVCYKEIYEEMEQIRLQVKDLEDKLLLKLRLKFSTRARAGVAKADSDVDTNEVEE